MRLSARVSNPGRGRIDYEYTATGGSLSGSGPNATWELAGVTSGAAYTATVILKKNGSEVGFGSTTVQVSECDCVPLCPTVTVDCPTQLVEQGKQAEVTANNSGGPPNKSLTYNWFVSAGKIKSGQGKRKIKIDTAGLAGQTITVTVEIGGIAPECQRTASCTFTVFDPKASNSNSH